MTKKSAGMKLARWGAAGVLAALPALAASGESRTSSTQVPAGLQGVDFEQRLNEAAPLNLEFTDAQGNRVRLGDYFGEMPVVLALVYYECPQLCTLELNGLMKAINVTPLQLGKEYRAVTISFDPGEGPDLARGKQEAYHRQLRQEMGERGWEFLTGSEEPIEKLARAVGFHYRYDPETDLYSHASGLVILTPKGTISKYLYGVEYSARDLRLALVEAADEKIGTVVDKVLLYCFHYDPVTGKYGVVIMNVLRLAGAATLMALVTFLIVSLRRERRTGAANA